MRQMVNELPCMSCFFSQRFTLKLMSLPAHTGLNICTKSQITQPAKTSARSLHVDFIIPGNVSSSGFNVISLQFVLSWFSFYKHTQEVLFTLSKPPVRSQLTQMTFVTAGMAIMPLNSTSSLLEPICKKCDRKAATVFPVHLQCISILQINMSFIVGASAMVNHCRHQDCLGEEYPVQPTATETELQISKK